MLGVMKYRLVLLNSMISTTLGWQLQCFLRSSERGSENCDKQEHSADDHSDGSDSNFLHNDDYDDDNNSYYYCMNGIQEDIIGDAEN